MNNDEQTYSCAFSVFKLSSSAKDGITDSHTSFSGRKFAANTQINFTDACNVINAYISFFKKAFSYSLQPVSVTILHDTNFSYEFPFVD